MPSFVVVLAPVPDHHPRPGQAGELLDVEQLGADAGVNDSANGCCLGERGRSGRSDWTYASLTADWQVELSYLP
jgi:hypothetical protein